MLASPKKSYSRLENYYNERNANSTNVKLQISSDIMKKAKTTKQFNKTQEKL